MFFLLLYGFELQILRCRLFELLYLLFAVLAILIIRLCVFAILSM